MIVKYKVTDFAKDTGLPVRKILDTLAAVGVKDKKNSSILEEKELNALLNMDHRDNEMAEPSAEEMEEQNERNAPRRSRGVER